MALTDLITDTNEALANLYAKVDALKQRFVDLNALSLEHIGPTGAAIDEVGDALTDALAVYNDIQFPTVEVESTTYIITVPQFIHNNVTVTAEELAEDAEMAAELIEMGSPVLIAIAD